MSKWDTIVTRSLPASFAGITLGTWLRTLRENHFAVDLPYWVRAATITFSSVPNTLLRWCENLLYARKIRDTAIDPPLFILGSWRSGTTHLHNLISQDERFGYPNLYQAGYPWTFLCTERLGTRLVGAVLPKTRPMDNVRFGASEPAEDEFALCSLTGRSFVLAMTFPRHAAWYDRYLTLRDLSEAELAEWKSALLFFLKKLALKHGRLLVLKSPGHTCRIRVLLDMFPDAKFVHIHRDPYAAGHFHELAYNDLEQDPIGELRKMYESLDLPDFAEVEPRLRQYTASLAGYEKNRFPPLPSALRNRIAVEWARCFEEWGYPK
jgi:hypothetical protein